MKNITRWFAVAVIAVFVPLTAHAVTRAAGGFTVGPDEIIDGSVIEAASVVEIAGSVNGDVIAAGNIVKITGPVAGDVIVAGNTILISGPIGGNVRAAGNSVTISGKVERNVSVLTSTLVLTKDAAVSWDVFALAATFQLDGAVAGNVWTNAGSFISTGKVGKNLSVSVEQGGQVVVEPGASVGGVLTYQAPAKDQLRVAQGASVGGEIVHRVPEKPKANPPLSSVLTFMRVVGLFGLLAVGLVMVTLLPRKVLAVHQEMLDRPWQSFGWGVIIFFLTPIAIILLVLTLIGLPLGLLLGALWLIGMYLGKVFVAFSLGLLVLNRLSAGTKFSGSLIWPLCFGSVLLVIIGSVPFLGWLAGWLLMLWALGALARVEKMKMAEYR